MRQSNVVVGGAGEATRSSWRASFAGRRVAVVGAGRTTGREVVRALLTAGHPPQRISLFGREARHLMWHETELVVSPFDASAQAFQLVFLCSAEAEAVALSAKLAAAGARVVDLSQTYRAQADIPLVATGPPEAHEPVGAFTPVVAVPARTTVVAYPALAVLEQSFGLTDVSLVCLASAASLGAHGIFELRDELTKSSAAGRPVGERVGNVVASLGSPLAGGNVTSELELAADLRRLLRRPDLPVDATVVTVDVERCDSIAYRVGLRLPADPAEVARLFASCPSLRVVGDARGPMPAACVGAEEVHVGRIRAGSAGSTSLCFFAVGDQLRFGAAVAALHVASSLPAA